MNKKIEKIVGQAPSIKAQERRIYWKDKSGDKLRL